MPVLPFPLRVLALALTCGAACTPSAAWAQPVRPIGAVQAVSVAAAPSAALSAAPSAATQVCVQTENAQVELTVYSPNVIRVRIDKQKLGRDFSYAVVATPGTTQATVSQSEADIVIATGQLSARVTRQPFAITFLTPDGKVISQDEPGLTTSWIGDEVSTYKTLQEGERFIGLGEKGGDLDRRGRAFTNWNTDVGQYTDHTDPLYASIPFYIGAHHGLSYGILFDNSYRSDFNFGASNNRYSSFSAHGGEMNYYFIHHPRVADIISSYTALTGRMPLPPLWSLGYQQNRYSYYPEAEVMRVAHTLREKKIPADGITLDIHYMDGYKLFTWDKARFPDPAGMTRRLNAMGIKTTVIVDPGIKVEKGYGAYERGLRDDVFLKYADGQPYTGQVWPGWTHFPDFTSENGRAWWRKEVRTYADAGVAGLWNDMNEIATWGQAMPNNILFDFDGRATTHKEGRNVFALGMVRSSYEGMKQATGKRPFMLTRSGFAGLQRYSAIWTGDNTATEEHMLLGVRLLNSLGVSGVAFTGMDVGGFSGAPSKSLYARWMQIGAFTPYFRNHAAIDSKSSEPWAYGEEVLDIARDYINLRYRLMPYLYSAFHDATTSGQPLMRTLAIDYTHDPKVYLPAYQNQYLFGASFLVAPFESTRDMAKVYFPGGTWYDLHTDAVQSGAAEVVQELAIERLPVYVKESSIVPVQSLVQSTAEQPADTLTLHIYKGAVDSSTTYYEDDGISFGYQNGAYYQRTMVYDAAARKIVLGAAQGKLQSKFRKIELVLHGFGAAPALRHNGKALALATRQHSFTDPRNGQATVAVAVVDNDSASISFEY